MKPLVYVAAPYTNPDPVWNTNKAIEVGLDLVETGKVAVIIPHLTLIAHLVRPATERYWYDLDLDQLAHCSALLRLPGASTGADKEVEVAHALGLPVFNDVADLLTWAEDWEPTPEQLQREDRAQGDVLTGIPRPIAKAVTQMLAIFRRKNADYSSGEYWAQNLKDAGEQVGKDASHACEVMIGVKQGRLANLTASGKPPANEAVEDTVLDRAVYALMAFALLLEEADLADPRYCPDC